MLIPTRRSIYLSKPRLRKIAASVVLVAQRTAVRISTSAIHLSMYHSYSVMNMFASQCSSLLGLLIGRVLGSAVGAENVSLSRIQSFRIPDVWKDEIRPTLSSFLEHFASFRNSQFSDFQHLRFCQYEI